MRLRSALLALCIPALLSAQGTGKLTLESLFHPSRKIQYLGAPGTKLAWAPDGSLVQTERKNGKVALLRVDPRTWEKQPLFEADRLLAALKEAGAPDAAAAQALDRGTFTWNEARSAFVVSIADDLYLLYLVDAKQAQARRLTQAPGGEDEPTFSPDGRHVAFLRGNDLYAVDTRTSQETRLTHGGSETVFNGRLDWVYQEEVYGRGSFRAFWWSPDSTRLAFISFDETKVPVYTLADDRDTPQTLLKARYPQAGDPNPIARLGVVDLAGATTWMVDPYDGQAGQETLLVQVGWSPSGQLLASFQNRVQTWLDLRSYQGADSKVLIHEQGPTWQERLPLPRYLKDGRFLWESDRSGYRHLYLYSAEARLLKPVTQGPWCVEEVFGVDEAAKQVYFAATERSFTGLNAYRARYEDKPPEPKKLTPKKSKRTRKAPAAPAEPELVRITQAPGTHAAAFSPDFSMFLDTWSDAATPRQQSLCDANGAPLRLIDENPSPLYKALRLGAVKYQQVKTRDGFPMETMLVLPPDFDPAKKYPVVQHIYGGPGFPTFRTHQVRDALSPAMLWYQFLAQQGYVVWVCDNRLASGKGAVAAAGAFHHLYVQELQDQMDGLAWLKAQGWADTSRVALEGWSYGGSMTAYALTHSKAYKVGIAGAPVTDWRLYDSIYTERFMGLPKENAAGYDASSILKSAGELHGKLLILHGTLDDNVHPQNTVQFIDALQKALKPVDVMLLPGSDHGPVAPYHVWARFKATWDFISENL